MAAGDKTALHLLLLLLLGLLWGMTYGLNKLALTTIPPLTLVTARVCLAALALWIVVLIRGCRWPRRDDVVAPLFVQGCLACLIPYVLIAFGQQSVDSALAAILNSMTPLFVCLIAVAVMEDETLSLGRWLGVALGLSGVVMIVGTAALAGLGHDVVGQLAIVMATLSSAAGVLYGRRLGTVAPELAAAATLTCAAVVLVPLCAALEAPLSVSPSWPSLVAVAANALLSTAFGFVVYFYLLRSVGSLRTASVGYLKPAVGVVIGCALMGEPLTWQIAVGLIVILFGVTAINQTEVRKAGAAVRHTA